MNIYYYLFLNGDKKPRDILINQEKEGYISFGDGSPVDWTKKDYDGKCGLIDVVNPDQPKPPDPHIPTIEEKTEQINAKYQPKLDVYKDCIVSAIAVNGPNQTAKVANISIKYNDLLNQKNKEVEELYNG